MKSFLLSRLLQAIPTLLIIATLTFFMTRFAPGGPFDSEKAIPEEIKVKIESHFGLNLPIFEQYFLYMKNLLRGDLGPSFKYVGWEVSELIGIAFPVSVSLGVAALLIALALGLPAGIIAALRKNTLWDYLPMGLAMIGICLPTFVLGPILILVFPQSSNSTRTRVALLGRSYSTIFHLGPFLRRICSSINQEPACLKLSSRIMYELHGLREPLNPSGN